MAGETHHVDILIVDDDIALDLAGNPQYVDKTASIGQDIKHMIRESGYLTEMLAERDSERRQMCIQHIIIRVEEDTRIVPGTVNMTLETPGFQDGKGRWFLTADTYQYGQLRVQG